jgi:hypothetical protein
LAPKISTVADLSNAVATTTSQKSSVKVTMNMGVMGFTVNGSGVARFAGQPAADMTITMAQLGQIEMILLNGTAYMKIPSALSQFLGTNGPVKPWIKIDPNGTDMVDKTVGPMLSQAQQNFDPATTLDRLKSAGTITSTKQEQLDGQPVTHYTITVDVQKLIASLPPGDAQAQELKGVTDAGITTETTDLWVNSDNLPLKFVSVTPMPSLGTGSSSQTTVTVNFSDWGAPVTVNAPPADQVGSLSGN